MMLADGGNSDVLGKATLPVSINREIANNYKVVRTMLAGFG
jgi:hypothetical protein